MEINNSISSLKASKLNNRAFKGKVIEFKPKNEQEIEPKTVDVQYYQAQSGIKPTKSLKLPLDDGSELIINGADVSKYLLKKDGSLDNALVEQFKSLYLAQYQAAFAKNAKEEEYFKNLATKNPNIVEFDTPVEKMSQAIVEQLFQNSWEESSEFELCKDILSNISGEHKDILLNNLISLTQDKKEQIPKNAYYKTTRLFQMSKTADGFDFSSLDKKEKLFSTIEEMGYQYGGNYDIEDLYTEVLENARKSDGTLDFELISQAVGLMSGLGLVCSPKRVINMIKKYVSSDKAHEAQILNAMKKLNKSSFSIADRDGKYENILALCFDENHKFDPKKEEKVAELMTLVDEWLEKLLEKPVGDVDDSIDEYEKCAQSAYNTVTGYFDDSINPNHLSTKDFFEQEIGQFDKGLTLI